MLASGVARRLERIFAKPNQRSVIVAMDGTLIAGDVPDPMQTLSTVLTGAPSAVLGFRGLMSQNAHVLRGTPIIVNLTASTIVGDHIRKTQVCSVEEACQLGADAVCVHMNIGNDSEGEIFKLIGVARRKCEKLGMPLMIIAYPRQRGADENFESDREENPKKYASRVAHCVRVAVDLGADLIKTHFTGSTDLFQNVVQVAAPVPLVVSGGAKNPDLRSVFEMVESALNGGASGICFGRNIYGSSEPERILDSLQQLVEGRLSASAVMDHYLSWQPRK